MSARASIRGPNPASIDIRLIEARRRRRCDSVTARSGRSKEPHTKRWTATNVFSDAVRGPIGVLSLEDNGSAAASFNAYIRIEIAVCSEAAQTLESTRQKLHIVRMSLPRSFDQDQDGLPSPENKGWFKIKTVHFLTHFLYFLK